MTERNPRDSNFWAIYENLKSPKRQESKYKSRVFRAHLDARMIYSLYDPIKFVYLITIIGLIGGFGVWFSFLKSPSFKSLAENLITYSLAILATSLVDYLFRFNAKKSKENNKNSFEYYLLPSRNFEVVTIALIASLYIMFAVVALILSGRGLYIGSSLSAVAASAISWYSWLYVNFDNDNISSNIENADDAFGGPPSRNIPEGNKTVGVKT